MRPKIVILTLLAAFVALGIIAVLKNVAGKNGNGGGSQLAVVPTTANVSASTNDNPATATQAGNTAPMSDSVRAALTAKQIEDIQELLSEADGSNNVFIINGLLDKLANPEPEVRAAVLNAFEQLNDTNAIPGMEAAANKMSDAREKVAVLDVIDYLRLPNITANVPDELVTNYAILNYVATNGVRSPHTQRATKPPRKVSGPATANTSPDGTTAQSQ